MMLPDAHTPDEGDHGEEERVGGAGIVGRNRVQLSELVASRTAAVREVERAVVMLKCAEGLTISEIQRQLGVSRLMIYKCIVKALAVGVQQGHKDTFPRPHKLEITEEVKTWVVSVACVKPKELGLGQSCGASLRWHGMWPNIRQKQAFSVFPVPAKKRSSAFQTKTI